MGLDEWQGNFMAAITICSDFGAQKSLPVSIVSPSICHEVMESDGHDPSFPRDGGTWWAAVYGVSQSQT